jgi:hypothetical protein
MFMQTSISSVTWIETAMCRLAANNHATVAETKKLTDTSTELNSQTRQHAGSYYANNFEFNLLRARSGKLEPSYKRHPPDLGAVKFCVCLKTRATDGLSLAARPAPRLSKERIE